MLLENKRFPQSNNNYPLKKFRKTNSSIKNLYKINEKNSLFAKETSKNKEKIQESFNLNEIISSNPFQRISRSIIKEMNIITTLDGFSEKKDKKTKKIKSKNEKTSKQTIQIKPEIKETLKIIENEKSLQNKSFELKLEECLLNLKNLKSKVLSKNKHEIAILSKLLNSYHDHGFSAEELFRSNVPKIFKTMYQFLNDVKIPQTEFVIIQLESILNHIKERVLDEVKKKSYHFF